MRDRLLRDGFVILSVVFVGLRLFAIEPWADSVDAYAYWTTRSGDYYAAADTGRIGAYLYSPAFAQLLAPLTWLPLNVFMAIWTGDQLRGALVPAAALVAAVAAVPADPVRDHLRQRPPALRRRDRRRLPLVGVVGADVHHEGHAGHRRAVVRSSGGSGGRSPSRSA